MQAVPPKYSTTLRHLPVPEIKRKYTTDFMSVVLQFQPSDAAREYLPRSPRVHHRLHAGGTSISTYRSTLSHSPQASAWGYRDTSTFKTVSTVSEIAQPNVRYASACRSHSLHSLYRNASPRITAGGELVERFR